MPRFVWCPLVILLWPPTAVAQTPSWCAAVDRAQVGALLGGTAPTPKQAGPQNDAAAGGVTTTCIFPSPNQRIVMTMRIEFPSVEEARKQVSADWLKKNIEVKATFSEEPGLGDRAFWAVSTEGASSIILKGSKLYMAVLGPGSDAAAQKPALVKLAQSLIGS